MKLLTEQEAEQINEAVEAWLDKSGMYDLHADPYGLALGTARVAVMEYIANLNHKTCFETLADKSTEEQPYVAALFIPAPMELRQYNPNYGDDRMCKCGHRYYRHFDTYENMEAVGCKYCYDCFTFEESQTTSDEE